MNDAIMIIMRHFIIIQQIYDKNITTTFQNLMILVYVKEEQKQIITKKNHQNRVSCFQDIAF